MTRLDVSAGELLRIDDVGHNQAAAHGDRGDRAHQLHRRDCHRALPDAHRNRFPGEPLLFEVPNLPLLRGHHSGHFVGQVNAGFLSQTKSGSVFGDAVDA